MRLGVELVELGFIIRRVLSPGVLFLDNIITLQVSSSARFLKR